MKKLLVIDDDADTLDVLGIIAKHAGVDVVLKSEVLPLSEIETMKPGLIILDHWIGGSLGGDLCREIKKHEATKDIPVILLSALGEIGRIAMDSCADGSIPKPFDIEEMKELIEAYTLF